MRVETKNKLFEAWAYCDELDKSTEFTFQYMADFAQVEYDVAVQFMIKTTNKQRSQWYRENQDWYKKYQQIKTDI